MQYFIGVVPPEEFKNKIIRFQKQWKNNTIHQVVEPHITLKAQSGLTENLEWIEDIIKVCSNFKAFTIQLKEPKFFGENDILYLSCDSSDLVEIHNLIVNVVNPSKKQIQQYFEAENFVAHMTLGKVFFGLTHEELLDMANYAQEQLTPYPTFTVDFIRIYRENKPYQYMTYKDIPLG
ncbi:2'-5' RNA ligase family protein [Paucisalibacillus sp. EB02]|uniref:2'-5' RNA ligase family protein n=1 Tax=Paucisalibacillus sp. EB02 TaxID=1347087 RepID=UPI000694A773|nr:2'-5' RNA ligase family protein [Paucisalibacillus sp. EB02]